MPKHKAHKCLPTDTTFDTIYFSYFQTTNSLLKYFCENAPLHLFPGPCPQAHATPKESNCEQEESRCQNKPRPGGKSRTTPKALGSSTRLGNS